MVKECKTYWVEEGTPSRTDIIDCLNIINTRKADMIDLCWFGPDNKYYGGHHSIFIRENDKIEDVINRLPKVYGV